MAKAKKKIVESILEKINNKDALDKEIQMRVFGKSLVLEKKFYDDLKFVVDRVGWDILLDNRQVKTIKDIISDLKQELEKTEGVDNEA